MMSAETLVSCLCLACAGAGPRGETVGAALTSAGEAPRLEISLRLEPLRAAAFLSYREKGIGRVRISNRGGAPASGLELKLDLPDRPHLLPDPFSVAIPEIPAAGEVTVEARPRFAPSILNEPTGEIRLRATLRGRGGDLLRRESLLAVVDRSSVTWDVPERVAALIDPLSVADAVRRSLLSSPRISEAIPHRNLSLAAQVFDVLAALDLRYLPDFAAPVASALLGAPADRVSLPAETWSQRAGDCDDLSVLLAAALEAAGVPCAFAVLADHVLVLFDLALAPGAAEASGLDAEALLEWRGRRWMPLEATRLAERSSTLLGAWVDARPRLPALRSGEARLFDVREAWTAFPAIAAMAGGTVRPDGGAPRASGRSEGELAGALRAEISGRAERARVRGSGASAAEGERLAAAVFAAAGYPDEAAKCLRRALDRSDDPSLHLDLAGTFLAQSPRGNELEAARAELEAALAGFDPLDLAARSEALRRLETVHRLRGDRAAAERARSLEAALFREDGATALAMTAPGAVAASTSTPAATATPTTAGAAASVSVAFAGAPPRPAGTPGGGL